jgi:outer membrane protein OmpA-like peptidoglycan-associated protein
LTNTGVIIPDTGDMSREEQCRTLNEILAKVLEEDPIAFEANSAAIQEKCLETVDTIARVVKAFAGLYIRCEGHTKGQPADNNAAKVELSKGRADAVSAALRERGVTNHITCVGEGSGLGLGIGVQIYSE